MLPTRTPHDERPKIEYGRCPLALATEPCLQSRRTYRVIAEVNFFLARNIHLNRDRRFRWWSAVYARKRHDLITISIEIMVFRRMFKRIAQKYRGGEGSVRRSKSLLYAVSSAQSANSTLARERGPTLPPTVRLRFRIHHLQP